MRKLSVAVLLLAAGLCSAQKRLVLIDQDGSGPGGSNQMAMLALLQAPNVEVLGITMVTGNAWRDEETLHTLRMLELTGHAHVPVARGAVFPLVRPRRKRSLKKQFLRSSVAGRLGRRPDDTGGVGQRSDPHERGQVSRARAV